MKKLLVVLLVLGLAAPAMAAEWNWFGQARVMLGWTYQSDDFIGNPMDDDERLNGIQNGNVLNMPSAGTAEIGANVKASDSISGHFSIGNVTSNTGAGETAKFRNLYTKWNFGAGTMLLGHTNTILNSIAGLPIGTDDDPFLFHGQLYESRRDQITFQFGGLELSAIQNQGIGDGDLAALAIANGLLPGQLVETAVIPKMEAAYTWKADAFMLKGGVGYQTFEIETTDGDYDESVDSWVVSLDARYRPGPWFVAAGAWYAVNPYNYGILAANTNAGSLVQNGLSNVKAVFVDGEVEDAEMYSIYLVGGMNLTDRVAMGAGVSYMNSQQDYDAYDAEDDVINWYLQMPITVAQGVQIIPEVGGHHFGDDEVNDVTTENGEWYYFSTRFQISF